MKIQEVGLFHTPKTWEELQDWLEGLNGSEKAMATTAAVMAWNLAAYVTNGEEE